MRRTESMNPVGVNPCVREVTKCEADHTPLNSTSTEMMPAGPVCASSSVRAPNAKMRKSEPMATGGGMCEHQIRISYHTPETAPSRTIHQKQHHPEVEEAAGGSCGGRERGWARVSAQRCAAKPRACAHTRSTSQ